MLFYKSLKKTKLSVKLLADDGFSPHAAISIIIVIVTVIFLSNNQLTYLFSKKNSK